MKIVEYNNTYAQKVADMWNKSNENWGNDESKQTKEDVIISESSSGNLKLYLAIDNSEVVGYCSFSEYKQDEGASYLPLLNVIPEYHGKKVGKQLILKVLEDAVKSKWTRFDLYTWSGNIKAMPLYKKCGFFWERKNDTVHLMNFIPYLYQTEALQGYLKDIDWYKDSKRIIDMEQDGDERSGFEYYRYDFENDKTKLALEFEKTGRGLRYIDTPDYSIEVTVDCHDLVFDNTYEVIYKIINKTDKELDISLRGKHNKNIIFDLNKTFKVTRETILTEQFYVGSITKDQEKGKTHPVIETDILINGLLANFRLGIEPKYPVKLELNVVEYSHILNKDYSCYLDIENNLDSKEQFSIKLPSNFIEFTDEISVELEAKQKKSIEVTYKVKEHGFYNEEAVITYLDKEVRKSVFAPFKGTNKSFTCLTEKYAYIVSGNYVLSYGISDNNFALINSYTPNTKTAMMVPSIGKPYSLEFNNTKPIITFASENDMVVTLQSKAFKDVELVIHINHMYGLATIHYELINKGEDKTLSLSIPAWHILEDNIIPFDGKLMEIKGVDGADISTIKHELVDENWVYQSKDRAGFGWDKDETMRISGWKFVFETEGILVTKEQPYKSSNFYFSYVHPNVGEFRKFLGYKGKRQITTHLDIVVNEGNPFTKDKAVVRVNNLLKTDLQGSLEVDQAKTSIDQSLSVSPGLKEIRVDVKDRILTEERLVCKVKGDIKLSNKDDILVVNNGLLSFKASSVYADSIYSLTYDNNEWLDSNYPTPKERVWWGDFVGGITQRCGRVQDISALKEERTAEFVSLTDNFGNLWQGIKVSLIIKKDEVLKGVTYETYCMTLPGIKMIHTFTNIVNDSGKLINRKEFHRFNTLKVDDVAEDVRYIKENKEYKCNNINVEDLADKLAILKGNRSHMLGIYSPENKLLVESQKGFLIAFSEGHLTIPDGRQKQFRGDFIFFTKDRVTKQILKDLDNIRFEV